jgi:hypothetical protein
MAHLNNWVIALKLLLLLTLLGCGAGESSLSAAPASPQQVAAAFTPLPSPVASPTSIVQHAIPEPSFVSAATEPPSTPAATPAVPAPFLTSTSAPAPSGASSCTCDSSCPCKIEHVVIISIDGLRPDALEQADTPTLDELRAQGAYSPAAQTVLPSVTLVSHASMLGGMSPEKHGIYWNSNDPDLGKVKGPTVFSVAHEAGLSTAMVVGKPKLEHLVLPDSVDNYVDAGYTDRQVVAETVTIIQTRMPELLFIHLPDVDTAGHALGWMSPGQLLAVNLTDGLVGEIVAALDVQEYLSQTFLVITSDHGGIGFKHGGDSPEDITIPWLVVGPGVPAGITLQSEIITYDTAATVLYALGLPIPASWDGQPVMEIFEQSPQ